MTELKMWKMSTFCVYILVVLHGERNVGPKFNLLYILTRHVSMKKDETVSWKRRQIKEDHIQSNLYFYCALQCSVQLFGPRSRTIMGCYILLFYYYIRVHKTHLQKNLLRGGKNVKGHDRL